MTITAPNVSMKSWDGRHLFAALVMSTLGCRMPRALDNPVAPDLSRTSDEIAVLTYNVQALPLWLGKWNAGRRMKKIRSLATRYDVVLYQEAFISTGNLLGSLGPNGAVARGTGAGAFLPKPRMGSGVAVASLVGRESIRERHARRYDICNGILGGYSDCLARKGFVLARLVVRDREVDVYTTHLDAGNGEKDRGARERQFELLALRIQELSGDRPIILGGDLNSEKTDTADMRRLDSFRRRLGLNDVGISDYRGWDEQLDYILYRGGRGISLSVIRKGVDEGFHDGKYALSDHPALFAIFRVDTDSTR